MLQIKPITTSNGGSNDVAKRKLKPQGRKRKTRLFITGYTETGNPVLGNVFIQCESRGVQLETIVQVLDSQGYLIDWIEFYEDAMDSMWAPSTTLKKIEYVLEEVKGRIYSEQVILRLHHYLNIKHGCIKNDP